jgi:hypothetical protein
MGSASIATKHGDCSVMKLASSGRDGEFIHPRLRDPRPPYVVPLSIDYQENPVQMPPPAAEAHPFNAAFPDLGGEHRPKVMPPEPDRLVADIHAAFVQKVFGIPKGK